MAFSSINTSTPGSSYGVAASSNGQYQIFISGTKIGLSSDNGSTWSSITSIPITSNIRSVAMSSDGKYITIVYSSNFIYRSDDYGVSFSSVASSDSWFFIAMDISGQYQTACKGTIVSVSSDYGATWSDTGTLDYAVTAIAINSTGDIQYASTALSAPTSYGSVYKSTDYGLSWTQIYTSSGSSKNINGLSCDSTGNQVAFSNANVYVSQNGGTSWSTAGVPATGYNWVATSADGKTLLALIRHDTSYVSNDNGSTWTILTNIPNNNTYNPGGGFYISRAVLNVSINPGIVLLSGSLPGPPMNTGSVLKGIGSDVGVSFSPSISNYRVPVMEHFSWQNPIVG